MQTAPKNDSPDLSVKPPRVEFADDVLQQIRLHARSSMQAEICGVLIGDIAEEGTRVTARIVGEGASQGGAHVTFTQATWEHIFKVKDSEFPSQSIVGWYHSHPGFGIFLSDYDLFIHENFFSAEHQIAWVFDPHSDEEGCFGWIRNKVEPLEQIIVFKNYKANTTDQAKGETSLEEEKSRKATTLRVQPAADTFKEDTRVPKSKHFAKSITIALMAFVGGVLAGPEILVLARPFIISLYNIQWIKHVMELAPFLFGGN
jgi:proteasome lid subunit RPN8/RPN11